MLDIAQPQFIYVKSQHVEVCNGFSSVMPKVLVVLAESSIEVPAKYGLEPVKNEK